VFKQIKIKFLTLAAPHFTSRKCVDFALLAGLLTCPYPERLPVFETVAKNAQVLQGLTAAGTVSDFHAVPFSSFFLRKEPSAANVGNKN